MSLGGQRKRFADGKISLPYKQFLGYEKGDDGLPKVIEKEAKTVRLIYRLFLEGKTVNSISTYLKKNKILSPAGKKTWSRSTVRSILTNEKYKGDALLQKQYTVDFLTKKRKKNNGEVPQYYVKNSHEAIIDPVVFDLVQSEMKIRDKSPKCRSSVSPFSSKIQCGSCGSFYGSKVWHSTDKYRKIIWQCNKKFKNHEKCKTPHIDENRIKQEFIEAFNDLIKNKNEVINDCKMTILKLTNTRSIDEKINKLNAESIALIELTKSLVTENSKTAMDQDEYNEKYDTYLKNYETIKSKLLEAEEIKQNLKARIQRIEYFIKNLESNNEKIFEFDEHLWYTMVEKVIVNEDGSLEFKFKNSVQ